MPVFAQCIVCAAIGYTLGAINPAYIMSRIKGFDIRNKGSGNAGASNAFLVFGKTVGVLCALFDIAKAYFAVFTAERLFPELSVAFAVAGVACIAGHVFPFYMKFKGGKGLACLAGIILYYDWRVFLALLGAEIVIVLVTDYICFVPVTAAASFPVISYIMKRDIATSAILAAAALIIFIKHIENFKRIGAGKELRFSYLWRPDDEKERIKQNNNADDEELKKRFSAD